MRSLIVSLALSLAACAPVTAPETTTNHNQSASGIRLTAVRLGDTTELTLTNNSTNPIGYNLCSSVLERRDGAQWVVVRTDEACTAELRILQPAGTASIRKQWPKDAGEGQFRYRTRVETPLGGGTADIVTDPL
jgi:hypothetical protein